LKKIRPGDNVEVTDEKGRTIKFAVISSAYYPYNQKAGEIFGPARESHLNLITCAGKWLKDKKIYSERLVVFTKRVR
jgi:hypothetical protein